MLLTGVVDTLPKPQDYKYSPWCLSLSIPNKLRNNPKPENVFSNGWLWKIQSKHREKPWLSMRLFIKTSMLKQSAFLPGVVKHSNSMFQKFPPPQPGHLPVKRPDSLLKPYISLLQVLLLWSWFHCQTGAPPPKQTSPTPNPTNDPKSADYQSTLSICCTVSKYYISWQNFSSSFPDLLLLAQTLLLILANALMSRNRFGQPPLKNNPLRPLAKLRAGDFLALRVCCFAIQCHTAHSCLRRCRK